MLPQDSLKGYLILSKTHQSQSHNNHHNYHYFLLGLPCGIHYRRTNTSNNNTNMNDTLIIKIILLNSYSISMPGLPYRFVPSSSVTWESVVSCVEESFPTYRAHSKDLVTSDMVYLQEHCLIVWEHRALLAHFGMDFLLDSNGQWYDHKAYST